MLIAWIMFLQYLHDQVIVATSQVFSLRPSVRAPFLRRENALVADFTMACEAFEQQQVKDGRVVISTRAKPAEGHERTYNLQVVHYI